MEKEKFFILEGVSSVLYTLISQGAIFTGLAIMFKLDEFELGVASSFPLIARILQFGTPYIVERYGKRKILTNVLNFSGRIIWVVFIILAVFLGWYKSADFLLAFAVSQILTSMASNIWLSWIRDLLPSDKKGEIFGKRNLYTSLATLVVFYAYSELVDDFHKFGYTLAAIAALVGSMFSFYYMNKLDDVPTKRIGTLASFKIVFQDKNFMNLSIFYAFWNFATLFTSPFFMYHLIKNLHVSFRYISVYTTVSSLIAMVFYRFFGRLADEVGHKSIEEFGISLVSITPILWLFMNRSTYHYMLLVDAMITGVGWSAINLAVMTLPMEVASGTQSAFFSTYIALGGIGGLIGSISGGFFGKILSVYKWHEFGMDFYGLQFLFVAGGIMRFLSLTLLKKVQVKKHVSLRRHFFNSLVVILRRIPTREFVYTRRHNRKK